MMRKTSLLSLFLIIILMCAYFQPTLQIEASSFSPNHGNVNIFYKKVGPYDDQEEYVFISKIKGWKAYIAPIGASQDSLLLYKTNDGGNHWTKITDSTSPASLITGGSILFKNSKIGWIINPHPLVGGLILYKTLDGGRSWKTQNIKLSSKYSHISFVAGLPLFLSQKYGIMFASGKDSTKNYESLPLLAFITHDGGDTWKIQLKNSKSEPIKWSINKKADSFKITYKKSTWKSNDEINWTIS